MRVILITSHRGNEWDGGDSVITHGLLNLLPELAGCEIAFSEDIPDDRTDEAVEWSDYIIHAGTPSWHRVANRRFWEAAKKHRKRLALLGVGLAVPYQLDFWYGSEAFIDLRDSGLIDLIICRDKFCYYWLQQRHGFDSTKILTLPCPGLFLVPPRMIRSKRKVIVSVCVPELTGAASAYTFQDYHAKTRHLIEELRGCGAQVSVIYQREMSRSLESLLMDQFGVSKIHSFGSRDSFCRFVLDHDVYVGVRNHGALACAGAGRPSLLLATDYRQSLADEIPFISKIDISHKRWEVSEISDWYRSMVPDSQQLVTFRHLALGRWNDATKHLRDYLGGRSPSCNGAIQNDAGVVLETS